MTRCLHNSFLFLYCPLNNSFPTPFQVENISYINGLQHYEACKAPKFEDYKLWHDIVAGYPTAHEISKASRCVLNFNHDEWSNAAVEHMKVSLQYKFWGNKMAREYLLQTGDMHLIFTSADQPFWGTGLDFPDPMNHDEANWKGHNVLGKLLSNIRDDIRVYNKAR